MQQAYFRALYELSGFTHEQLAKELGVSTRSVERWCSKLEPPEDVMVQMKALDQAVADLTQDILDDIDELLEGQDDPFLILIHAYRDKAKFASSDYWKGRAKWVSFSVQWAIVKRLYCVLTAMDYEVRIIDMEEDNECVASVLFDAGDGSGELISVTF